MKAPLWDIIRVDPMKRLILSAIFAAMLLAAFAATQTPRRTRPRPLVQGQPAYPYPQQRRRFDSLRSGHLVP